MGNQKGSIKDLIRARIRFLIHLKKKKKNTTKKIIKPFVVFFTFILHVILPNNVKAKEEKVKSNKIIEKKYIGNKIIEKNTQNKVIEKQDEYINLYLKELKKIEQNIKTKDNKEFNKVKLDYDQILYKIKREHYDKVDKIKEKLTKIDKIIEKFINPKFEEKKEQKVSVNKSPKKVSIPLKTASIIPISIVPMNVIENIKNSKKKTLVNQNKKSEQKEIISEINKKQDEKKTIKLKELEDKVVYISNYIEDIQDDEKVELSTEKAIKEELKDIDLKLIILEDFTNKADIKILKNDIHKCEDKLKEIIIKKQNENKLEKKKDINNEFNLNKLERESINLLFKKELMELDKEFSYLKLMESKKLKRKNKFLNKLMFKINLLSFRIFNINITRNKWINKLLGASLIHNKIKVLNNLSKESETTHLIPFNEVVDSIYDKKSCIDKINEILEASYVELLDFKERLIIEYNLTKNNEIINMLDYINSIELNISKKQRIIKNEKIKLLEMKQKVKRKKCS